MVFITSYEFDDATSYLHLWATEVHKYAKERGLSSVHFSDSKKKSKATKENITKYLERKNPQFVFLNGHGSEKHVCGHKNKKIFSINDNEALLKNKIVYVVACSCGQKLGPSIISKGKGKAFIGYERKFCIPIDESRVCTPFKDNLPKAIKEMSNIIPISIINSKTVNEAKNYAKIKWFEWLDFFQRRDPSEKAETILWALYHNINSLSIHGNINASTSYY